MLHTHKSFGPTIPIQVCVVNLKFTRLVPKFGLVKQAITSVFCPCLRRIHSDEFFLIFAREHLIYVPEQVHSCHRSSLGPVAIGKNITWCLRNRKKRLLEAPVEIFLKPVILT